MADRRNRVLLSAASVWEVAIKMAAGKLEIPAPFLPSAEAGGLEELPIRSSHAARVGALPPLHRDPFDRMLVAQAIEDGLVVATRDPMVQRYPVAVLRA
jgi:PIN domain nuclease of toxin-antitoxin system